MQDEVTDLETDVDFLFDEEVIQDEKLLNLGQETEVKEQNIVSMSRNHIFSCIRVHAKIPSMILFHENLELFFSWQICRLTP